MAVRLIWSDSHDEVVAARLIPLQQWPPRTVAGVVTLIDRLLDCADRYEHEAWPTMARRQRRIANDLGDALDALPRT